MKEKNAKGSRNEVNESVIEKEPKESERKNESPYFKAQQ